MLKKSYKIILLLILTALFLSCSKNTDTLSKPNTKKNLSNNKILDKKVLNNKIVIKRISLEESKSIVEKRKENKLIVIDIRTKQEYDMGHIENSKNIDFYKNFKENINKLDKTKKYLIYCRSSNRSRNALQVMKSLNFQYVLEMDMGIKHWKRNGWKLVQ